jgi:hypothetical protein
MSRRYHPERSPRVAALLAAVALTAAMLAAVHVEAGVSRAEPVMVAAFTGEITKDGPVYRLPPLEVKSRAGFPVALPGLLQRAFDAHATRDDASGRPDA